MSKQPQNKEEFLAQLRTLLRPLPQEEFDSAILYYEEYLEDAGEESLPEALAALGSPREIAAQLLKGRAAPETLQPYTYREERRGSTLWIVIVAVFASPIVLPLAAALAVAALGLALAVFAVALTLVLILFGGVLILGACALLMVLAGVAYICLSVPLFFQHVLTGFYVFGLGLLGASAGTVLFVVALYLARLLWRAVSLLRRRLPTLTFRRGAFR